jgi:hypothetical protein
MSELATPALGAIDVKVARSTQGVSLEVDVKRPREPGETYEEAADESARLAARAYRRAAQELEATTGLVPGRDQK